MRLKDYRRMTGKQLVGRRVCALRELNSGMLSVPAGAVLTIKAKGGGFRLQGPKCAHCQVAVYFTGVPPEAVDLLA